MGVKKQEELLCKVARLYSDGRTRKDYLLTAAELFADAKKKARDCRDKWKIRKRLGQ